MNGCSFLGAGCLTWWWSSWLICSPGWLNDLLVLVPFLDMMCHISEEPSLRKPYTLFLLKGTLCYPKFSFPGKWNQWNPRMEILEDDVLFQRNDLEVPAASFRGSVTGRYPKWCLFEASINWTKKAFLQASPLHFCAGPRPYFVAFNWIFPPVSVIIDHKQHHKSSIAMFSRGLPFNLWNYWLLEGKTNNPSYLCVARMVGQRLVDYRNAFEVEARPQRCGDVFFGGGV